MEHPRSTCQNEAQQSATMHCLCVVSTWIWRAFSGIPSWMFHQTLASPPMNDKFGFHAWHRQASVPALVRELTVSSVCLQNYVIATFAESARLMGPFPFDVTFFGSMFTSLRKYTPGKLTYGTPKMEVWFKWFSFSNGAILKFYILVCSLWLNQPIWKNMLVKLDHCPQTFGMNIWKQKLSYHHL